MCREFSVTECAPDEVPVRVLDAANTWTVDLAYGAGSVGQRCAVGASSRRRGCDTAAAAQRSNEGAGG